MTTRRTTTAAVILSLAAAGTPAASARPVGPDMASVVNSQSSGVRPNPDEQTATGATANPTPATVYSRPDKSLVRAATPSGGRIPDSRAQQTVVRIQTPQSGFDWGDAGIGAAGGVALAMLGLGGALVVSNRRPRRTRQTTALPS